MSGDAHKIVLMADDDAEDCMLATEAFKESEAKAAFVCVKDGVELMDYLADHCSLETGEPPALILLDLSMPRKDGFKALIEIKSDPALQYIPIVILTTSADRNEADATMRAGAESFITKPAIFDEWVRMMRSLAQSYLS